VAGVGILYEGVLVAGCAAAKNGPEGNNYQHDSGDVIEVAPGGVVFLGNLGFLVVMLATLVGLSLVLFVVLSVVLSVVLAVVGSLLFLRVFIGIRIGRG